MTTNCNLCQSSLEIEESGGAVFCPKCDRNCKKNVLGLNAINESAALTEANKRLREIEQTIDEVTIQYNCIKCGCPTNQYGWCLWFEDGWRETL